VLTSGEFDVIVWPADLSAPIAEIDPEDFGHLTTRAISPDGTHAAYIIGQTLHLYDLDAGAEVSAFTFEVAGGRTRRIASQYR